MSTPYVGRLRAVGNGGGCPYSVLCWDVDCEGKWRKYVPGKASARRMMAGANEVGKVIVRGFEGGRW